MQCTTKAILVLFALGVGLLLAACGGAAPPPKAAGQLGEPERGPQVFQSSGCAACHTTTREKLVGSGLAGVTAKDKLPNGKPMSDDNLIEWIRTGGTSTTGAMPPNPNLTDQQLRDLVAYLKTLK